MKLTENVETYLQKKRAERSETIRKRNQEPNRRKKQTGWGKMADSGYGGLNRVNKIDLKDFLAAEQRNVEERVKKPKR
ncbi:hypothetical protein [Enterococcus thailandicus]|uniref:Uncharacterized protein n=1 Tax=Enterococcus thailandicus TaxID=417368 RepID=A0A179ETT7_ENTTH|nr:hypothetical protein [Enterococcus thailandicus]MDT2753021.1 hypothetical protein [Enterococcus thailandicus]MDT2777485.1 hypothetical protein [Enterococcus thailandicus]MDT2795582.1 hypothetical protein [Enterococcus thailandicus]OAQ56636.1 hypothetical protein A6E74_12145 [Enterococcus thailandicus]GMC02242.1 hypothetical protein K2F_25030 [Enterococcus thailandicus]